jgi:hypothetical protein
MSDAQNPPEPASNRTVMVHRVVIALYAILTLAALGRSSFQVITKFDEAPLAYSLSTVAAVLYLVATITLAYSARSAARTIATVVLSIELGGVLAIGAASLALPQLFEDATVWSQFGLGYLFIPLFLPILGLWWLRRGRHFL